MNKTKVSYGIVIGIWIMLSLSSQALAGLENKAYPQVISGDVNVSNSYIDVVVDPMGDYTMATTGGNPAQLLLFGYPSRFSSYLTVRIDDTNYYYRSYNSDGNMGSYKVSGPTVSGNSIITAWLIGDIGVTQTISIATSSTTGREDTALFKVSLTNNGNTAHSVGARFLFDTKLGSNDYAPFRVPGIGDVTTEQEFNGSNVPAFWQAFDSLSNPSVISQGTLATSTPPNRFIMANWGNLHNAPWDYAVSLGSANGDSATAVYWNPVNMQPGRSVDYSTAYGLGGVTITTQGALSLGITSPINATVGDNFTITAYLQNTGNVAINNIIASTSLPAGITLASSETSQKTVGALASGASTQVSWNVRAAASGNYTYYITLTSSNAASVTGNRSITIAAASTPVLTPTPTPAPTTTSCTGGDFGIPGGSCIFSNGNIGGIFNNPTSPTTFTLTNTYYVMSVTNYHWNTGSGSIPGTVSLRDSNGNTFGPWTATTRPGQGGVPNAYWDVRPNITLVPGTYTIIDSNTSTWSQNSESSNRGQSIVKGTLTTTPTPTPTPGSTEADMVVLVGDIDNLGFGWPTGFDVFSGASTPSHSYPFQPNANDQPGLNDTNGTDRIMVGTSYNGNPPNGQDGYTSTTTTSRQNTRPQAIDMQYGLNGIQVRSATLQMFVDDFQSPRWGSRFQVTLNGQRASFLEDVLNVLDQTGPIGKLITVQIPADFLPLVASGHLSVYIDDPTTGAGDGYAIDFVRLLVNPHITTVGLVTGMITDDTTGLPLQGVQVSASGTVMAVTGSNGSYTLNGVPAGLVVVNASKTGYVSRTISGDLVAGSSVTINFAMSPAPASTGTVLVSDSFNRANADTCSLGQADLALGGSGTHFYLPIFPSSNTDPSNNPRGANIVSSALQNNGLYYGGVQLTASSGACSNLAIRGENIGQDINIKVDLTVPTDSAGHITQAGPYLRNRAAASGDGILGGTSSGYWIQLHSTGEVKVKNVNPATVVAFSGTPTLFDTTVFHTVEIAAQGSSLQVALDGRLLTFNQSGNLVTTVSLPLSAGSNDGTAGIAFGSEPNQGIIGGQRADNLRISSFSSLANLPVQNNFAATPTPTPTGALRQWASGAFASSEYSSTSWSAAQATGAPDTFTYGDIATSWATLGSDDGVHWIELNYTYYVYATGVNVRETFNPGTLTKIELKDNTGVYHTVWAGRDPNTGIPDSVGWSNITFAQTSYPTNTVKLYLDTSLVAGWNEIDAVELAGLYAGITSAPTPTPTPVSNRLSATPATVSPGDSVMVTFSGPGYQTDWIAIYSVNADNMAYGEWFYLEGRTSGTLSFTAPSTAGSYEFRMFKNWPDGGYNDIARSNRIIVTEEVPTPTVTVTPAPITENGNVSNRYIDIVVAPSGSYTMGTIEGDPGVRTDDNKLLLYGYPNPRTSYLTVRIDGIDYYTKDGSMNQYRVSGPAVSGNSIITAWRIGDISITQTISITTSSTTGREDTALFKVSLENKGSVPHRVGARFLFDTMLGSNDAAPFRVPGLGDVTTERNFNGSEIPAFWQAFDSLRNPSVISQGTLATSTPPNRFIMANWGNLYAAPWDYSVHRGSENGDSATAVYWNPVSIQPGRTSEYSTAYGLGGVTLSQGVLSLGISSPTSAGSGDAFTVTAYIQNTGSTALNNVNALISPPSGLALIPGETGTRSIGTLASGTQTQVSWNLQATATGAKNFSVSVSASNVPSTSASRTINIVPVRNSTASVVRSISPPVIQPGSMLNITLTPSPSTSFDSPGYQVTEIIPQGFTFVGTDAGALHTGSIYTFTQIGSAAITYTLGAPSTEGSYSISGTFKDELKNTGVVSGTTSIRVGTAGTGGDLLSRYDANQNGRIDRDEAIRAVMDYFTDMIARQDAISVVTMYFIG